MLKQSSDIFSLQKQFKDLNSTLITVVANLTRTNNPLVSTAIQDITLVSQGLQMLQERVGEKRQIEALMGIGKVINSSLGKERVLEEVMDSLIHLTRAERGFLMLRGEDGELRPAVARGIEHINLLDKEFEFSSSVVRRVVESGESVVTTNAQEDPRFEDQVSVSAYQLRSILCAPLTNKEKLIGVIYVDNRIKVGLFKASDREMIEAFANHAAIAIDNALLFDSLQKSNRDLERMNRELEIANVDLQDAYQATLEGWVHALDLKDKETEGHTQRVTILTERLARSMGVDGEALINIKRGALLHDIGKMGIPDEILRKKGELTEDERTLIREHPNYARKMLKDIEFLRHALDIPYCHHEKWDGTGYPRGLKGMEIPFAARVFSVIDVWDALVMDRPYRKAMPPDEVRGRIKADAGRHFDPNVVKAFLELKDLSV
jgi:putative nucleotidyltransferase with HDIG domain